MGHPHTTTFDDQLHVRLDAASLMAIYHLGGVEAVLAVPPASTRGWLLEALVAVSVNAQGWRSGWLVVEAAAGMSIPRWDDHYQWGPSHWVSLLIKREEGAWYAAGDDWAVVDVGGLLPPSSRRVLPDNLGHDSYARFRDAHHNCNGERHARRTFEVATTDRWRVHR